MIKKNKLFLALLFIGVLNTAMVKTGDQNKLPPCELESGGDDDGSYFSDNEDSLSDNEDSLEEHAEQNQPNNPVMKLPNPLMRLPQTNGFVSWSMQGFSGQFGGLAAKTIFAIGGDIVSRYDVFKSARVIKLEGIHDSLKQAELDVTKNQKALTAAQKISTDAQTKATETQEKLHRIQAHKELISAPTAREVRIKKRLELEGLQARTRYEKTQALYQEQLQQKAETETIGVQYIESIKTYNTLRGTKEKNFEDAQIWIDLLSKADHTAQVTSLKDHMLQALKNKHAQNAINSERDKRRLERELEEENIDVDSRGFVKRRAQRAQRAEQDNAPEELSESEKQYDSYIQKASQELSMMHIQPQPQIQVEQPALLDVK